MEKGHPVDWWFVFKFNAKSFPGCGDNGSRACPFGGTVQTYPFGQQYLYASSDPVTRVDPSGRGALIEYEEFAARAQRLFVLKREMEYIDFAFCIESLLVLLVDFPGLAHEEILPKIILECRRYISVLYP